MSYLCKNEVERLTAGSLFRQDFCSVRTCDASQLCKAQLSPCTAFKEWLSFHKANSVHHSPIFFRVYCSVTCFKNVLKESDDFFFFFQAHHSTQLLVLNLCNNVLFRRLFKQVGLQEVGYSCIHSGLPIKL